MTSRKGRPPHPPPAHGWLSNFFVDANQPSVGAQAGARAAPSMPIAETRECVTSALRSTNMADFARQQVIDEKDGGYPEIPTDDLGTFMTTLVDGVRADGAELAQSAKEAVASTFHVVVRPLAAVARLASPFFPQQPIASRQNTESGQAQLDNAVAFRIPGSFSGMPRPSLVAPPSPSAAAVSGASGGVVSCVPGGQAVDVGVVTLPSVNGISPPRAASPPSRFTTRSSSETSVLHNHGRGRTCKKKLGAVKLANTPPGPQDRRRQVSCSPLPGHAKAAGDSSCTSPAAGRGGRRGSLSASPRRNGGGRGAATTSAVFGDSDDVSINVSNTVDECQSSSASLYSIFSPERKPTPATAIKTSVATTTAQGAHHRRESSLFSTSGSPASLAPGSRVDLRGLDRATGAGRPRAYHCRDGSVVVIGKHRMLSVRPEEVVRKVGAATAGDSSAGEESRDPGGVTTKIEVGRGVRSGVVTWVMFYEELESCCVNVSAGKERERERVGDVVVEVTTRPAKGGNGILGKRSFCLTNPSDCLDLLQSIQGRWQLLSSPDTFAVASPPSATSRGHGAGGGGDDDASVDNANSVRRVKGAYENEGRVATTQRSATCPLENPDDAVVLSTPKKEIDQGSSTSGGDAAGESLATTGRRTEMSPFSGVNKSVIMLESPAKVLRDQLRERHEAHEKGLKEDLASKAQLSRASLQRRRQQRRTSGVAQGGAPGGLEASSPDPAPVPSPAARGEGVTVEKEDGVSDGGDVGSTTASGACACAEPEVSMHARTLQAGVPEGAVRHKMYVQGLDDAAIALAFPPPPSPSPSVSSSASAASVPFVPQPNASPMLPPAPRPALRRSATTIGLVAPTSPPPLLPPPPLPPPKIPGTGAAGGGLAALASDGNNGNGLGLPPPCSPLVGAAVGNGGDFFGSSLSSLTMTPPDTPTRNQRRTSVPMLNLHWDVLPARNIERTVWARASLCPFESVDDDEVEELEKLFSKTSKASPRPLGAAGGRGFGGSGGGLGGAVGVSGACSVGGKGRGAFFGAGFHPGGTVGKDGRVKQVQLLDVARGNNVAIALKSCKIVGGPTELAKAIEGLDPKGILTCEDLQRLETCLPTGPELKTVLAFDGPVEALGPAETFFRSLAPTPRPSAKVSALLFAQMFPSMTSSTSKRLDTLRNACNETMKSDRLARVLERVLVIGNLLNEGTYKGNASGFRLSSLLKLSHTKSHADKKTTVLRYIVRSVAAKTKAVAGAGAGASAGADAGAGAETAPLDGSVSVVSPSANKILESRITPEITTMKTTAPTAAAAARRKTTHRSNYREALEPTPLAAALVLGSSPGSSRNSSTTISRHTHTKGADCGVNGPQSPVRWPRGAPAGCGGSHHRRESAPVLPPPGVSASPRTMGGGPGGGGRGCSGGGRRARLMKVEILDLEAELGHVRVASKVPVGEIMLDVMHAKQGLEQTRRELELVLAEGPRPSTARSSVLVEEALQVGAKRKGKSEGTVMETGMSTAVQTAEKNIGDVFVETVGRSTDGAKIDDGAIYASTETEEVEEGREREEGTRTGAAGIDSGIRALARFVETAGSRLSAIDEGTSECVALCRGLGEFFGEGADDEAHSAHIFSTLVQFLDLLEEAKNVEGIC